MESLVKLEYFIRKLWSSLLWICIRGARVNFIEIMKKKCYYKQTQNWLGETWVLMTYTWKVNSGENFLQNEYRRQEIPTKVII
jgi:hypothetical protein